MIALGGPTLKPEYGVGTFSGFSVSMIALGGPTLKHYSGVAPGVCYIVSMIALGGPTLKLTGEELAASLLGSLNDSTGRACQPAWKSQ